MTATAIPTSMTPKLQKTTYQDLMLGARLRVRLPDGSARDAMVMRVGPIDRGWTMLTLSVGDQTCYLPVSEMELA